MPPHKELVTIGIYIIKVDVCLYVCAQKSPTSHCPILNLSTDLESPGHGGCFKDYLGRNQTTNKNFSSMKTVFHRPCVSVPYVCLSHYLPHMCVCPNAFLVFLQLLYLSPPKGGKGCRRQPICEFSQIFCLVPTANPIVRIAT